MRAKVAVTEISSRPVESNAYPQRVAVTEVVTVTEINFDQL